RGFVNKPSPLLALLVRIFLNAFFAKRESFAAKSDMWMVLALLTSLRSFSSFWHEHSPQAVRALAQP
ncbi:hypothetical protein, partial [uncultured Alistipes sp.]|uniref:hypothetical protein n=1 Tax=uncultured Alistipes sp. TaxID=538949 RepID=UPI0025971574